MVPIRNSSQAFKCKIRAGSAKANGREDPRSGLGRIFNFKFGRFVTYAIAWYIQTCPRPELKIWSKFCLVSLS